MQVASNGLRISEFDFDPFEASELTPEQEFTRNNSRITGRNMEEGLIK